MIIDLYSKRQKKVRGEIPDVFSYDTIPQPLRVQIVQIWKESLGDETEYNRRGLRVEEAYRFIVKALRKEYGVFCLGEESYRRLEYMEEMIEFFLNEQDTDKVLDVIELSFGILDIYGRRYDYRQSSDASEHVDDAIKELNSRFKEHGIGFQYEQGKILRVDSQLLHAEVIKPALRLLNGRKYAGAQEEFLSAYEHYRQGKHKEALNDALKSFESTMKAIFDKRGWEYDPNDTSKRLIETCYKENLIPAFWQQQMSRLRSLLEGGVPTARNKLSGHGQGVKTVVVPEHIVAYVLHMTAAAIVFLVNSDAKLQ